MLFVKYLLLSAGIAMFVIAAGILTYDAYLLIYYRRGRLYPEGTTPIPPPPAFRWRTGVALVMLAWAPLLVSAGIVIVPAGMAGVRVSQTKGTLAGTLYPGVHFVTPLVERVEMFNTRDQLFTTGITEDGLAKGAVKGEPLRVQAKEGLTLGLAITVRYQVDPKRLDYIEANLPQPLEKEIVPPVVATAWRELVPSYTVREVFSAKREEVRQRASDAIRKRLAADGIVVKEVMLLPLFLIEIEGTPGEPDRVWDEAWQQIRKSFGSGRWNGALRKVEEAFGPLVPMRTDDGKDVWREWKSRVVPRRGVTVHGRLTEIGDPSSAETAHVVH